MKAYKGTDKDMKCRGFQYELGKTYEAEGEISLCKNGFHACLNPLDCISYYPFINGNRYFEVELKGVLEERSNDSKIVGKSIRLIKELTLQEMIEAARDCAHSATSGDYARSATSGDYAHSATSGNGAHSATSGNGAHSATSGDWANSVTSGNWANSSAMGKHSIAAALGMDCMVKGALGNVLILMKYDEYGHPIDCKSEIVDGTRIKENTWYKIDNETGEFKESA